MIYKLKYTNYIIQADYFNVRQYRPRNKDMRALYYVFMLMPSGLCVIISIGFLTITIPADILRIAQGLKIKLIRDYLKNKRMQEMIEELQKEISLKNDKISMLTYSIYSTKTDLQKLIDIVEKSNNNAIFVAAYLKSTLKDLQS